MGLQNDGLLAGMRAGGDPDRPFGQVQRGAQRRHLPGMVRWQGDVELDAARGDHLVRVRAQGLEAPSVVWILASDQAQLA